MNTIDDVAIRRLDLGLLLTFELLLRERNMSAVAEKMGLTQSSVSHAVSRLRSVFDDPLFVRKGSGVEPTAKAIQLGPALSEALSAVRNAIRLGRQFDPATSSRRFTISAPDTVLSALGPLAVNAVIKTAPRCSLMLRNLSPDAAKSELLAGEIDVAIGMFSDVPAGITATPLARDGYLVAGRRDHPLLNDQIDIDTYCKLDHLLVSHDRDGRGIVDDLLRSAGRNRRIVALMPQMLVAFAAASKSDAIFTAPTSACEFAAALFPLTLVAAPLSIPALELTLIVRSEAERDPALVWLIDLLRPAIGQGGPS